MTECTMANQQIQFQHGISIPELLRSFGDEACAQAVKQARWRPKNDGSSLRRAAHANPDESLRLLPSGSGVKSPPLQPRQHTADQRCESERDDHPPFGAAVATVGRQADEGLDPVRPQRAQERECSADDGNGRFNPIECSAVHACLPFWLQNCGAGPADWSEAP